MERALILCEGQGLIRAEHLMLAESSHPHSHESHRVVCICVLQKSVLRQFMQGWHRRCNMIFNVDQFFDAA
jgi:hypothetical protein